MGAGAQPATSVPVLHEGVDQQTDSREQSAAPGQREQHDLAPLGAVGLHPGVVVFASENSLEHSRQKTAMPADVKRTATKGGKFSGIFAIGCDKAR